MAKNSGIIVDTDIGIKIFRGDKEKRDLLEPIQDKLGLSVITVMELMNGAKSKKENLEFQRLLKPTFYMI